MLVDRSRPLRVHAKRWRCHHTDVDIAAVKKLHGLHALDLHGCRNVDLRSFNDVLSIQGASLSNLNISQCRATDEWLRCIGTWCGESLTRVDMTGANVSCYGLCAFTAERTNAVQAHLGLCHIFSAPPKADLLLCGTTVTLGGELPLGEKVQLFATQVELHDISIADQPQLVRFQATPRLNEFVI